MVRVLAEQYRAPGVTDLGIESLVQVPDVAGMAAPILDLLRDDQRRHRLEDSGRARVMHLDWSHLAARFSDVLEGTLR